MKLTERFLQYVKFDTQSDELTNLTPSTPGQMVFARALEKELHDMGLSDISLDENGYLFATLPSNTDKKVPTVGFIAHMDTAPDMSGHDVKPRIVDYQGGKIVLNQEQNIVLDPEQFPELNDYVGQQLIVTDGTTLLGADDKAGVAEIMTMLEVLITKNICISRYRKRKIETESISDEDFLGGESASKSVEMADEQIIKQRLYDTLTRTERLYMLMKAEQGMSLDEMVQETGGTRASIKVALSKAKKKIEKQLKRMGYGK